MDDLTIWPRCNKCADGAIDRHDDAAPAPMPIAERDAEEMEGMSAPSVRPGGSASCRTILLATAIEQDCATRKAVKKAAGGVHVEEVGEGGVVPACSVRTDPIVLLANGCIEPSAETVELHTEAVRRHEDADPHREEPLREDGLRRRSSDHRLPRVLCLF